MLSGGLYHADDPVLSAERHRARLLFQEINQLPEKEKEKQIGLLRELLGSAGTELWIEPPFFCDYGYNIHLGDRVYINFNCCILDVMKVEIGNNVLLGPQVQIYTATHPLDAKTRASQLEYGKPVTIGNDVWIGAHAVISAGVTIGNGVVVAAGAVVTENIADWSVAGGVPAKVIRTRK